MGYVSLLAGRWWSDKGFFNNSFVCSHFFQFRHGRRKKEGRSGAKSNLLLWGLIFQSWGKQSCSRLCQRQSLMSRTQTRSLLTMQPAGTMGLSVPLWRKMSVLFITYRKARVRSPSQGWHKWPHTFQAPCSQGVRFLHVLVEDHSIGSQFQKTTRLLGEREAKSFLNLHVSIGEPRDNTIAAWSCNCILHSCSCCTCEVLIESLLCHFPEKSMGYTPLLAKMFVREIRQFCYESLQVTVQPK